MPKIRFVEMPYHKSVQMFVDMEKSKFPIGFSYIPYDFPSVPKSFTIAIKNNNDRENVINQFKTLTPEKVFSAWIKDNELKKYDLFVYTNQKKTDWDVQELIKIFEQVNLNSITFYVLPE